MKRHISYVLSLWALLMSWLALTGCGGSKAPEIQLSEADDTGIYVGETIPLGELEQLFLPCICASESNLYILTFLPITDLNKETEICIYKMDLQNPGNFEKMPCEFDKDENVLAMGIVPETDDFCLLVRNRVNNESYIAYFNSQGERLKVIDMTETYTDIEMKTFLGIMAVDREENYYFRTLDNIFICNSDGQKVSTLKNPAPVAFGFTYDRDKNLYYLGFDKNLETVQLRHVEDKRIESIIIPKKDEQIELIGETCGGILFKTEQGVWTLTENQAQLLIDFAREGIDYNSVQNICMTSDGSIYLHVADNSLGYQHKLYKFTADGENADRQKRTTICLAGRYIGDDVKSTVSAFNMAQDKIFVQTEEYGTDEAEEKKLLMDIASSDTIDLLCVQDRYEMKNPGRYLENIYSLMAEAGLTDNVQNACLDKETKTCFYAFPEYALHTMNIL